MKIFNPTPSKDSDRWFEVYMTASAIIYFAQKSFNKSPIDELIIIVIAIGAGCFCLPLTRRLKINNRIARIVVTCLILLIASGFLIGFLTGIANALSAPSNQVAQN